MLRRTHPILLVSKHLLGRVLKLPDQDPFSMNIYGYLKNAPTATCTSRQRLGNPFRAFRIQGARPAD